MTSVTVDKPITLSDSTLPPTAAAALRYTISLLGTYLVTAGYLDADTLQGLLTIATVVATVAYGLYKTRSNRAELITAAKAAPNSVAVVKAA